MLSVSRSIATSGRMQSGSWCHLTRRYIGVNRRCCLKEELEKNLLQSPGVKLSHLQRKFICGNVVIESTMFSDGVASDSRVAKAVTRRWAGPHAIPKGIQPPPGSPIMIRLSCRFFLLGAVGSLTRQRRHISIVKPADKPHTCTAACKPDANRRRGPARSRRHPGSKISIMLPSRFNFCILRGNATRLPAKWTEDENLDSRRALQSVEYADG